MWAYELVSVEDQSNDNEEDDRRYHDLIIFVVDKLNNVSMVIGLNVNRISILCFIVFVCMLCLVCVCQT